MKKFNTTIKVALIALGLSTALQTISVEADTVHKVKEGDTFYKLAAKYNVDMNTLMNVNPSIKANNIYEGLNITIPEQNQTPMLQKASAQTEEATVTKAESTTAQASTLKVLSTDKVVEAWGKPFNYSNTLQVKATAYSAAASENGGWGPVDYYGNDLKLGTIAVDPKVIPMGTKVLVTGHSHPGLPKTAFVATATDQGGAIKGNRIDIFIPGSVSYVNQFGYQDVTLYILK
jgi:3D (Asp-Asp-Asp) domain-containing protein/LysM repeat protein